MQLANHLLGSFQRRQLGVDLGRGGVLQVGHFLPQRVDLLLARIQRLLAVRARDQVLRAQPDQTGCQQRGAGTQADQEWFERGQQARIDFKRARLLGRDDENGGLCDACGEKTVNDRTGHGTARKTPHDWQALSLHLKRRLGA